jgi:hypothetical protein
VDSGALPRVHPGDVLYSSHVKRTLAIAALILAGCGSGRDLPAGAYKNEAFGLAVLPPEGWTTVTPDGSADFIARHGDRLLDTTREALTKPVVGKTSFVAAFFKTDSADPIYPIIAVSHNSVGLPQGAGEREKEMSEAALKAKFKASRYVTYQKNLSDFIGVDSRNSIRLGYHGEVDSILHSDSLQFKRHPIRMIEIMVPSRNWTHFVSVHADPKDWAAHSKTFDAFLKNFRSLDPH